MATEQALREQNQQLRKQLENMNNQMQVLMAQIQANTTAQTSQVMQETQQLNIGQAISPPPAHATIQIKIPPRDLTYPQMSAPEVYAPQISQETLPNLGIANAEAVVLVETAQQMDKKVTDCKVLSQNHQPAHYSQQGPAPKVFIQAPQRQIQTQQKKKPPIRRCPPLPVSQAEIFKQLVTEGLIKPVHTRRWVPPYPAWYNPNVNCAYHDDVPGHSTENCNTLRQKIYELIKAGNIKLSLGKDETPQTNDQIKINLIREEKDDQEVEEICWQGKQLHVPFSVFEEDSINPSTDIKDLNYQYKLACATTTDFGHLMNTGSRIEAALRSPSDNSEGSKKKEDSGIQRIAVNTANTSQLTQLPYQVPYQANYQPQSILPTYYSLSVPAPQVCTQTQDRQAPVQRMYNLRYPPLPVSQEDLYKQLVEGGLLGPIPTRPYTPPYPTWFDQNVKCTYHSGVMGHSIENCVKLRQKIYELVNAGSIKLNLAENKIIKTNKEEAGSSGIHK